MNVGIYDSQPAPLCPDDVNKNKIPKGQSCSSSKRICAYWTIIPNPECGYAPCAFCKVIGEFDTDLDKQIKICNIKK